MTNDDIALIEWAAVALDGLQRGINVGPPPDAGNQRPSVSRGIARLYELARELRTDDARRYVEEVRRG